MLYSNLAFYDERNLFKKLKNPQGVFSREKSAKRFGVIRSLQLAETVPVALRVDGFEIRDYGTRSRYVTSGSAVFKFRYKQFTMGSRLGTTATASTSFPVQQH